jgi:hypothetical protein
MFILAYVGLFIWEVSAVLSLVAFGRILTVFESAFANLTHGDSNQKKEITIQHKTELTKNIPLFLMSFAVVIAISLLSTSKDNMQF